MLHSPNAISKDRACPARGGACRSSPSQCSPCVSLRSFAAETCQDSSCPSILQFRTPARLSGGDTCTLNQVKDYERPGLPEGLSDVIANALRGPASEPRRAVTAVYASSEAMWGDLFRCLVDSGQDRYERPRLPSKRFVFGKQSNTQRWVLI